MTNAASLVNALLDRDVSLLPKVPAVLTPELANTRLRTVEDIYKIFKHFEDEGQEPPFRFVYCARSSRATGLDFRPYDITVIPRTGELPPPEHWVVSPTAVVHVKPGALTEVVLIEDWLRQTKQFDAISKLPFFRRYLLLKHLRAWRSNVRYQSYHLARTRLSKHFFLAKATFAKSTIELRKLAFAMRLAQHDNAQGKIAHVQQPPLPPGVTPEDARMQQAMMQSTVYPMRTIMYPESRPTWGYTQDAFLEAQRSHMTKVAALLNRILDAVARTASDVAERVASLAVMPDMQSFEELDKFLAQGSSVGDSVGTIAQRLREVERQDRKRELKRRIIEYDLLQPWVRLLDIIITSELFHNAQATVLAFVRHLDLPSHGLQRELKLGFEVSLVFHDDDPVQFVPDERDFTTFLRNFLNETIEKLSQLQRLIDVKELRQHFFAVPNAKPLAAIMGEYRPFNDSLDTLNLITHRDFADAADKSRPFEPCRTVLHYVGREWPETNAQWQQRVLEKIGSDKILQEVEIRKHIVKVGRLRLDLSKVASRWVGILALCVAPLVSELMGRLDAVMSDIKTSLLVLAQRRVTELAKDLEANIALLKHPGEDLRSFAEWIERCNTVDEASKRLLQDSNEVETLYQIADENHFDIPQLQRDKRDRTVGHGKGGELPLRLALTDAIDAAKAHKALRLESMHASLKNAIHDTINVLDGITNDLRHGEYREATHSSTLIMSKLSGVNNTLQSLRVKQQTLDHYAELLGMDPDPWREMDIATREYQEKNDLWSTVAQWDENRAYWNRTPVSQIDGAKMKDDMTELYQKAHKLHKANDNSVSNRLLNAVSSEKTNIAVMVELCNPALKEEHWLKIFDGIGRRLPPAEARTLETLRTFGAYEHADLITAVSSVATGEYTLLNQVNKIAQTWEEMPFNFAKNKGSGGKPDQPILGGLDDIMLLLEDHQVQIQTCMASRYVTGIRRLVEEWDGKLKVIYDVLTEWINVQKSWLYLEFIFSSDDIKKQLPEESRMFSAVDKTFRALMNTAVSHNVVAKVCCEENLLAALQNATANLDRIQKRLEDYLETKRVAFPRFYFLSNDELLSILSDVRNPTAVQPHLQKCFDNIKELAFESQTIISAMKSQEGEIVPFSDKIRVVGNVEHWLTDIEAMMRRTLYDITKAAYEAYPNDVRTEWYFRFPAQVVGCVDQIIWTAELETVWHKIKQGESDALVQYLEFYKDQILDTVGLVKGSLTSLQRTCCCTLIVIDVHARDVVSQLIDARCETATDFNWLKQLRYYWESDSTARPDCHIRHAAAHIMYGYEYLGNPLRLVITPLTERAFLTCTGALHMYQGAAPQGPAGTGKTESVKDLGKALARQVVVFNCSDGLNYKMMSQMFAGLAQAGAWACFDEFNRIEIEVLSVVAQQMLEITTAIAAQQTTMIFDGHNIRLNKNFGVFITMNPGYAGRTELPDNLKALFRPICMMIPDYALIAEIMFFSEGFSNAKPLAQKMVKLYSLASQQLSKQDHYDFGMRAVKSILVMAGALKRAEPNDPEDMILIRAMRDSNIPKFLRDDTKLFLALIQDLFPAVDIKEVVNLELQREATDTLVRHGYEPVEGCVQKIMQLHETMVVRHGVMLVGQAMTGKTRAALTLAEAYTMLHKRGVVASHEAHRRFFVPATIHRLNPKSISMNEMYGDINRITREWQDGVLSNIVRDLVRRTTTDRHWVCFDGPVDAIWIENMNTVLDDNKLLCLVNGERIKIPDTISIVFEVGDLRHASPATVSRCGMVYLEPYYLGWFPIAKTFSETVPGDDVFKSRWNHPELMALLERLIPQAIAHCRTAGREYIATVDAQLVLNLLQLLQSFIANIEEDDDGDDIVTQDAKSIIPSSKGGNYTDRLLFNMLFAQAFIWSFGANMADAARQRFSSFARTLITDMMHIPFPTEGTVFDYFVHKKSQSWVPWNYKVPKFRFDSNLPYFDLIVLTSEVVAMRHIMKNLCSIGKHILVNGVTGTGKSSTVNFFLYDVMKTEDLSSSFTSFSMSFSAQTTSLNLQEMMEAKLVRRRGDKELGPPPGKRLIMAIDDCNMPQLEQYGAAPPIELIRQVISQGGFYDRKKLFWKEIIDLMFIASCGEPGGGKNEMTLRLTSRFHCMCAPSLPKQSMKTIFMGILGGFLASSSPGFPSKVVNLANAVVDATLDVYERIASEMLPTPEKTHYTFNMRDVSKVIQGILQIVPAHASTPEALVKLWVHESSRVFSDRLINTNDRQWWKNTVAATCEKFFVDVTYSPEWSEVMYGSWAQRKSIDYQPITDMTLMHEILKEQQQDYNVTNVKDVDLVLFDDAVQHLARLCRILRQPRGNALLVGVGGSGRHSLTALASHVCGMLTKSIVIVRNYGINEFREDLRNILLQAGTQQSPLVFLFSDTQIVVSQFLEDINNVLNIGEIPGLMGPEEMDKIMASTREACRAAGKPETRGVLYQTFVSRCRENLHVIMCMSPVGAQFRDRLRMFPSLVNCVTIDWYMPWPAEALLSVARRYLGPMRLDTTDVAVKDGVCKVCVLMHQSVKKASEEMFTSLRRRNYTTPTSYLSLLTSYIEMYAEQRSELLSSQKRLTAGLETLRGANQTITRLKAQIREMQPVLARASKQAEEQAAQLVVEKKEADAVKTEVAGEEAAARELMNDAESIKSECQARLDEAMPALLSAQRALNTLKKSDIDEIKTFAKPPVNVEKTMDAVLVLLGEKDGWASAKAALGKIDFLSRLTEYDKESLTPAIIRKLQRSIQDKDFVPDIIEQTSVPCKSLCMWVHAMYKYYHVNKDISPLREKLAVAEAKVATARGDLNVKQARLAAVVAKIEELQRAAKETEEKKASLEHQISEAQAKLGRADELLSGLQSEGERWQVTVKSLADDLPKLVGTILLAAGCVAYIAPFPADFRQQLLKQWASECVELGLPVNENFSLDRITSQYKIREWVLQSLPKDQFSIENAVVLERSRRWCLLVDPQGQANLFIRKREGRNRLRVIKLTDDNYMRTIESAVQVGHPVLIENVGEELDAALDPVLLRQFIKQGNRYILKLGDKEVEYDPSFRLYLTTKLSNPTFTPELQIKVTVVNFTVTRAGLEDQQLADIVSCERADLQERSDQCVVAIAEGQDKLKQLEDAILKGLAESTGDILDNVDLIETLKRSKQTADAIVRDLADVAAANEEINAAREKYRPLASRGSLLYSVIAQLAGVDPMYQYSLQFFKQLFVSTIQKSGSPEGTEVEARVQQLMQAVTNTSYNVICRGLFEKDKMLFSFLLAVTFLRHNGTIPVDEWVYFLRGSAGKEAPEGFPEKPSFLARKQWNEIAALASLAPFAHAPTQIIAAPSAWQQWVESEDLFNTPPPLMDNLSEWHRLLLCKAVRPEKAMFSMSRVVAYHLGNDYTVSPQFSMRQAFEDSNCITPLIFVLSAGTDPTVLFTAFAAEMGYVDRKLMLSLGQDQGKRAAAMIEEGRKDGLWVYLQNCHVYVSWMSALERIVENIKPDETHPDFRLWLTSNPSPAFPVAVLQSGMKLTREPPRGLRANVKDSVHSLDLAVWEEQNETAKEHTWKRLIIALCFFHGVVQERRKFGPLGWNIPYDWSLPDLAASIKSLRIALNDFEDLSWPALQFSIGTLNYGGRVTDFLDERCLNVLMLQYFNPALLNADTTFDDAGVYRPVEANTKDDLLDYINELPQYEPPTLFGLHVNASISFQAKESNALLSTIIDLQPRGGSGGSGADGVSADDQVLALAGDLVARLPQRIDVGKAHKDSFAMTSAGIMTSLGTFLSQEVDQFNRLLRVMKNSLDNLMRAIRGEVVMSTVEESMYSSFLFNQVPTNWKKDGYLCLKPLASYFTDLIARVTFMQTWVNLGPPTSFWMPGFFFPQGFVTCVFQTYSRLHRMPIDTIRFDFHPLSVMTPEQLGPDDAPSSGVYVHGLFIEGAGWNAERRCLEESHPGVLHVPLPIIHFKPVALSDPELPDRVYECPLYKTSSRAGQLSTTGLSTNFLLRVNLAAGAHSPDHYVRRGVAALCMLDD